MPALRVDWKTRMMSAMRVMGGMFSRGAMMAEEGWIPGRMEVRGEGIWWWSRKVVSTYLVGLVEILAKLSQVREIGEHGPFIDA